MVYTLLHIVSTWVHICIFACETVVLANRACRRQCVWTGKGVIHGLLTENRMEVCLVNIVPLPNPGLILKHYLFCVYIVSSEWANRVSTCLCACLCVCVSACMYMSLCVCVCMHVHVFVCVCLHACTCLCMCVHIPVRVCPCLCLHACVGVGVRMHAHVCVHMPLCVYLHACVHVRERERRKNLHWMMAESMCIAPSMDLCYICWWVFFHISIKCLKTTVTVCLSFVWPVQSYIQFYSSVNWCVCVCVFVCVCVCVQVKRKLTTTKQEK